MFHYRCPGCGEEVMTKMEPPKKVYCAKARKWVEVR